MLPDRLRRRVNALNTFTVPLLRGPGASVADAGVLTELAGACRDGERLRFEYRDHSGSVSRRTVEPHRLVCTERRWYLVAWDLDRADWRTFRADRITPTPPHGPRFVPREPPAEDLAAYVARGISTNVYPMHAVIRLKAGIERVAERISPAAGVLEALDDDTCLLRTGAIGLDVMVVHVMLLGFDFEVVEPPELKDAIKVARDRLTRALD
ncbi:hypothetical protein GCM10009647_041660 [Streptomyces sanglieri]